MGWDVLVTLSIPTHPKTQHFFGRKYLTYRPRNKHRGFEQPFGCFDSNLISICFGWRESQTRSSSQDMLTCSHIKWVFFITAGKLVPRNFKIDAILDRDRRLKREEIQRGQTVLLNKFQNIEHLQTLDNMYQIHFLPLMLKYKYDGTYLVL